MLLIKAIGDIRCMYSDQTHIGGPNDRGAAHVVRSLIHPLKGDLKRLLSNWSGRIAQPFRAGRR